MSVLLFIFCSFFILVISVFFDLTSQKISNKWSFVFFILALSVWCINFFFKIDPSFLTVGPLCMLIGLVTGLVLFQFNVLGGGDSKLLPSLGLLALSLPFFRDFFIFTALWAAVLSISFIVVKKSHLSLLRNLKLLISQSKELETTHKIPFTIPLLMGWSSSLQVHIHSWGEIFYLQ